MFGFGGKKEPTNLGAKALEMSTPPPEDGKSGATTSVHGFDPTALERAAKAARDLDASKNAKQALQLISETEKTKQSEAQAQRALYQAQAQELAIKRVHEEEEAAARTLEKQTQHDKARADYADKLERKRMAENIDAQRRLADEERHKNEESAQKIEQMRRSTLDHEAQLRQQTEMARVKAEAEGRILQERTNHDLIMEKAKLEAAEYRDTVLQAIKLFSTNVGSALEELVTDRSKLTNVALGASGLALGVYAAKTGTGILGRFIEANLGKPSLVRDTSRVSVLNAFKHPIKTVKSLKNNKNGSDIMKDIVLNPELKLRMDAIGRSTAASKKNMAPFRNLLLHGPPGTGKTMYAKSLAHASGLDYAILTGGDIAPLGRDAVTEIHKLFNWAKTSSRGLIIFVDEAEAFLRKRDTNISEDQRNALNAFLFNTGESSKDFMIVFATNHPEQLDWAVTDRIDNLVEFNLPNAQERQQLILQYIEKYLSKPENGAKSITVNGMDKAFLDKLVKETEGFSGRDISKLCISWQSRAYGTELAVIDTDDLWDEFQIQLKSKTKKLEWNTKK